MIPKKLIAEIKKWITDKFYGNIQINFVNGRIMSWNTTQSHKDESTTTNESSTSLGS